jgi:threonine aldolase
LAEEFDYRCKQAGQLASKMRILSAPWAVMLQQGHWLRYAHAANDVAQMLAEAFHELGIEPLFPAQANSVFVPLSSDVTTALHDRGWHFYDFIGGASRFMCSWKIESECVEELKCDLQQILGRR